MGALAALDVLGKIGREDGRTALDAAMVLFAEGERGMAVTICEVRRDVLRQYPMLTGPGHATARHRADRQTRRPAERQEFCSVFDLAPRRLLRGGARGGAPLDGGGRAAADLVDQPDPYARSARSFWPFGRRPATRTDRRSAS